MKWMAAVTIGLAVLSCTPSKPAMPIPVDVPLDVPGDLRACAEAPVPPPLPRTIQQVGDYTHALAQAHADCTRTLRRLNRWLSDKKVTRNAGT